jgi:hypothetical protein
MFDFPETPPDPAQDRIFAALRSPPYDFEVIQLVKPHLEILHFSSSQLQSRQIVVVFHLTRLVGSFFTFVFLSRTPAPDPHCHQINGSGDRPSQIKNSCLHWRMSLQYSVLICPRRLPKRRSKWLYAKAALSVVAMAGRYRKHFGSLNIIAVYVSFK